MRRPSPFEGREAEGRLRGIGTLFVPVTEGVGSLPESTAPHIYVGGGGHPVTPGSLALASRLVAEARLRGRLVTVEVTPDSLPLCPSGWTSGDLIRVVVVVVVGSAPSDGVAVKLESPERAIVFEPPGHVVGLAYNDDSPAGEASS